jgi:nucleoid-associated protein YgaU
MGLFDHMFGKGAGQAVQEPNAQQRFDQLKQKYQPALAAIEQQQVRLQNLHVQDNKLFIRGVAPSEQAKDTVWTAIKQVNPKYDDITADLTVSAPQAPAASAPASTPQAQTYVVKSGDTLSKISKHFYGDANEYMRIFYANRGKLTDPDKIQVGQQLVIPAED